MRSDGQQPHILAINDSLEILSLMREILEEEAFRFTMRINSQTDIDEVTEIDPSLIILDYSSETETGLLHRLTTDPRTEQIPIILCTGALHEIQPIEPELDAMGVGVVYKPFDIEHLVRMVREALGLGFASEESLPPRVE